MNTINIAINIQQFHNEPLELEYVPFQSPSAIDEAKKHLAYNHYEDLPGSVTITISRNNELIFVEHEHTEDLFITLHCLVGTAIRKLVDSPEKIVLLDNVMNLSIEKQGEDAQFTFESNTFTYGHEIKKSPFIPVNLLLDEILKVSKEFIRFCQDANLQINEGASDYAMSEKVNEVEKE